MWNRLRGFPSAYGWVPIIRTGNRKVWELNLGGPNRTYVQPNHEVNTEQSRSQQKNNHEFQEEVVYICDFLRELSGHLTAGRGAGDRALGLGGVCEGGRVQGQVQWNNQLWPL